MHLFDARVAPEPPDVYQVLVATAVGGHLLGTEGDRTPDLSFAEGSFEGLRHHSNHSVRLTVQFNPFPNDIRVSAKIELPHRKAKDHDIVRARLVLGFREHTSESRFHTRDFEETGRHVGALHMDGRAATCQVEAGVVSADGCDGLKRRGSPHPGPCSPGRN